MCVAQLYNLWPSFNIINKYKIGDHILKSSHIFTGLKYSRFVSYLYGLMQRILCLPFISPYCNMTVPLVKHCVITNGPWLAFRILMQRHYLSWLLSLDFKSLSSIFAVMVISFTIFVYYTLINLHLLSLAYLFLIYRIFIGIIVSRPNLNCLIL